MVICFSSDGTSLRGWTGVLWEALQISLARIFSQRWCLVGLPAFFVARLVWSLFFFSSRSTRQ